jgi:hypothetical protein
MDKREKPPFYTDKEWAEYLRQHPNLDDKGGGGQREKPDYFTDEEWAEFLREHPDFDGKVVRLDKTKRKGKKPPPPGGWPPWFAELRTDERGRVYPDLRNVLIALRREPQTCSACEMAQDPIVAAPQPLAPDAKPSPPPPRQVTDDDVSRLQEWLQHVGLPRIGRDTVRQAVEALAREHRFHPIRDWLDSLVWDRVPRLGSWLYDCLETPDDDYHRRVGQMFLNRDGGPDLSARMQGRLHDRARRPAGRGEIQVLPGGRRRRRVLFRTPAANRLRPSPAVDAP